MEVFCEESVQSADFILCQRLNQSDCLITIMRILSFRRDIEVAFRFRQKTNSLEIKKEHSLNSTAAELHKGYWIVASISTTNILIKNGVYYLKNKFTNNAAIIS